MNYLFWTVDTLALNLVTPKLYELKVYFDLFIIYFLIKVFLYSYFPYYFTFNFIRIIKNKIVIRKK